MVNILYEYINATFDSGKENPTLGKLSGVRFCNIPLESYLISFKTQEMPVIVVVFNCPHNQKLSGEIKLSCLVPGGQP